MKDSTKKESPVSLSTESIGGKTKRKILEEVVLSRILLETNLHLSEASLTDSHLKFSDAESAMIIYGAYLKEKIYNEMVLPLQQENTNLKTCMIAAAEEIQAHWQSHCDKEGYGPANLMHRLEKGIPAQYGYTAGAFAKQDEEIKRLRDIIKKGGLPDNCVSGWDEVKFCSIRNGDGGQCLQCL